MSGSYLVLYISVMPIDVGIAAICSLWPKTQVKSYTIPSAKQPDSLLKLDLKDIDNVLLLGTYWNNSLSDVALINPNVTFTVYCSKLPDSVSNNLFTPNVKFILQGDSLEESLSSYTTNTICYSGLLEILDDRLANRNLKHTQACFTGLFNFTSELFQKYLIDQNSKDTTYSRFKFILDNDSQMETIFRVGEQVMISQKQLCKNRVDRFSKLVTLKSGIQAAITTALDLIELTHDALHQKYDTKVTITTAWKFIDNKNQLTFSVRSYDSEISASSLIESARDDEFEGGGDRLLAGGTLKSSIFMNPFDQILVKEFCKQNSQDCVPNPRIISDPVENDSNVDQQIIFSQDNLCKNRVENFSKTIVLKSGIQSAIVTASDLIDTTHKALHQKYNTVVTITTAWKFMNNDDQLTFTVKSHDNEISALDLIRSARDDGFEGGGDNGFAWGVLRCRDFQNPF
jgi:hypothetical protein